MVVAKILKSNSGAFHGIDYNQRKVEEGKAEILQMSNVGSLCKNDSSDDLKMLLKAHSESNDKIKSKQFHLTISAKGKEKSFDELKEFANHYMNKMGYGKNPYVMYAHKDTGNNHIHVVSSRVGNDGKKINDSYERFKSQAIILDYYAKSINIDKKLNQINKYHFSTDAQYQLLLEKKFKKVKVKNDSYQVFNSNQNKIFKKPKINKKENKRFYQSKKIKLRKDHIKNLIFKKASKQDLKTLNPILKKDDIELVFFKRKDTGEINGYSIIDHKSKAVFKGSEVISLNKLNEQLDKIDREQGVSNLLKELEKNKQVKTIEDLNSYFIDQGLELEISKKGEVFEKLNFEKNYLFRLPKSVISEYLKNSNITYINEKLKPSNLKELEVLSAFFKIKRSEIALSKGDENLKKEKALFYNKFFENFNNIENKKDYLEKNSIKILKYKNEYFILDDVYKNFVNIKPDKEFKNSLEKEKLYTELKDFSRGLETNYDKDSFNKHLSELMYYSDEEENTQKKKKKRNKSI